MRRKKTSGRCIAKKRGKRVSRRGRFCQAKGRRRGTRGGRRIYGKEGLVGGPTQLRLEYFN